MTEVLTVLILAVLCGGIGRHRRTDLASQQWEVKISPIGSPRRAIRKTTGGSPTGVHCPPVRVVSQFDELISAPLGPVGIKSSVF